MTATMPRREHSSIGRRAGYAVAVVVNAVLWYLINITPGWRGVWFLTGDTERVVWLVNLSILASLGVNLIFLAYDPAWLIAAGGLITTAIGLAAMVRIWQVFPFDLDGYAVNWPLIVRTVLVVGIVGASIGVLAQFGLLVRAGLRPKRPDAR